MKAHGAGPPPRPVFPSFVLPPMDNYETISARDYTRLCDLIYSEAGIALSPSKKVMIEVRIRRRLKALAIESYSDYCVFLYSDRGLKEEPDRYWGVVFDWSEQP